MRRSKCCRELQDECERRACAASAGIGSSRKIAKVTVKECFYQSTALRMVDATLRMELIL